jgi:hypothetical protein
MTETDFVSLDETIDALCHHLRLSRTCAAVAKERAHAAVSPETPTMAAANVVACEVAWGDAGYRFLEAAEPYFDALLGGIPLTHDLIRGLADTGDAGALVVGRIIASPPPRRAPHPDRRAIPLEVLWGRIRELCARLGIQGHAVNVACYKARTAHLTRYTPAQRAAQELATAMERLLDQNYLPNSAREGDMAAIFTDFLEGRAATQEQLLALAGYGPEVASVTVYLAAPPTLQPEPSAVPPKPRQRRGRKL